MTVRRPVYTNLPMKWRTFRAYLRLVGNRRLDGLVHLLTRELMVSHCRRFSLRARWRQRCETAGGRGQWGEALFKRIRHKPHRQRAAWWSAIFACMQGRAVYYGPEANELIPGSLVIADECGWWFSMKDQASEERALEDFLSMHRHGGFEVWWLCQAAGRISISIRTMAMDYWRVQNARDIRINDWLPLRWLGIQCFQYQRFSGEQVKAGQDKRPEEVAFRFPQTRRSQLIFRLYHSFSHGGTVDEITQAIAASRRDAGLDDLGETGNEGKQDMAPKIAGGALKYTVIGALVAVVLLWASGNLGGGGKSGPAGRGAVPPVAGGVVADPTQRAIGKFNGAGADYVYVGTSRVRVGERGPAGESLVSVAPDLSRSVWKFGRLMYYWHHKQPSADLLGDERIVAGALAGRAASVARARTSGGSVAEPAAREPAR